MLVDDPDEAAHRAEAFLKDRPCGPITTSGDKGAVTQLDVNRGRLDHERRVQIKEAVQGVIDDLADHTDPSPASVAEVDRTAQSLASPGDELPPAWREKAVLCIAGRGLLDEAAAAMLAQLLERQGIGARVVSSEEVSAANMFRLDVTGAQMGDGRADGLSFLFGTGRLHQRSLPRSASTSQADARENSRGILDVDRGRRHTPRCIEGDGRRTHRLRDAVDGIVTSARDAARGLETSSRLSVVKALPPAE